ncbi:MAG: carnitine 3-dehydrogenase [Pseudomonadota bacterium]
MFENNAPIAVVGGGVIGAAWAARFRENGLDVRVYDPARNARAKLDEVLGLAERAYARLTLAPRTRRGDVQLTSKLADALDGAAFVQEAAPERLELKQELFADIEHHIDDDTIIASSTSGFKPSDLQRRMRRPERLIVGHPFNPVYLLPLVEIVAGEKQSSQIIEAAKEFYAAIGMHPLHVRKEIDAFIADRLMEALWREALWLVNDDIATAEEIDDAIRYGCGLRWAQMGTFQVFNVAGGEQGMRHFMAQFGPALKWPWTKLMDTPEMDEALIEKIATQCEAQSEGLGVRDLERIRDDNLIAIMQALKARHWGAGATLAAYEKQLYARAHGNADKHELDVSRPLRLHETAVQPEWTDYNNHMNEARYLQVFCDASDAFLNLIGVTPEYVAGGKSYYTVETHIRHIREVAALEPLAVDTQLISHDEKRMQLFQWIRHGKTGEILATGEQMFLHVDAKASRACSAERPVIDALARIAEGHAKLERPEGLGRAIGDPR